MINPEDEFILDLSTSCTKEEAVAKLLGWRTGSVQLQKQLRELREAVRKNYIDNVKSIIFTNVEYETQKQYIDAMSCADSIIEKAHIFILDIDEELAKGSCSALKIDQETTERTGVTHIKLRSLDQWAKQKYHISTAVVMPITNWDVPVDVPVDVTWEDIVIRIRKDNIIAYSHEKGKWKAKTFGEAGLLDRKRQAPNILAVILIGLSHREKFPTSRLPAKKDKTAISRLRKSLHKLTGIEDDPFLGFNEADGWKPRFKLTDDRRNADNRAKESAIHTVIDDGRDFDDDDDEAGEWIKNN